MGLIKIIQFHQIKKEYNGKYPINKDNHLFIHNDTQTLITIQNISLKSNLTIWLLSLVV